ncbi:aminoglycoside phosphotransferase family protein [Rossellomorea vietnamensis]|uniref:Aminoglycoside phosphotransferase family protein n=1 Tax=Rossellomorea vietnamensis TaxID=218284 RepID=A0ACD4CDN9_9BACI|nr:aminoglycoside phosphotransferase family protein [Rossellomorea vietnamensis]UXH46785.1 aminoglycoside phosphotransferase family protein [Rossellomorea vietnamensis]
MESRLSKMNLEILNMKEIGGAHAGYICKVEALRGNENTREHYIYKEFAEGRDQEVEVHKNIEEIMPSFSRVVNVWETSPKAMLMWDLGCPVKAGFEAMSIGEKKMLISDILKVLASLHGMDTPQDKLPAHQLNAEWKNWCLDQMGKLCSRKSWASPRWERTIQEAYERLDIPHYQSKCPSVITHGDPHLENVFYKDNEVWFIDWEWAAIGSPLRDVTILMQDLYDDDLIAYVPEYYLKCMRERGITLDNDDFWSDLSYLYIDHLTMMLAWEVEKYFQGYLSEKGIRKIIEWKIGEIERVKTEGMDRKKFSY